MGHSVHPTGASGAAAATVQGFYCLRIESDSNVYSPAEWFGREFQGTLVVSLTGRLEPEEAPAWQRRAFRYLFSFPVIGLCLVSVFVVMFMMLQFQASIAYKALTGLMIVNSSMVVVHQIHWLANHYHWAFSVLHKKYYDLGRNIKSMHFTAIGIQ